MTATRLHHSKCFLFPRIVVKFGLGHFDTPDDEQLYLDLFLNSFIENEMHPVYLCSGCLSEMSHYDLQDPWLAILNVCLSTDRLQSGCMNPTFCLVIFFAMVRFNRDSQEHFRYNSKQGRGEWRRILNPGSREAFSTLLTIGKCQAKKGQLSRPRAHLD